MTLAASCCDLKASALPTRVSGIEAGQSEDRRPIHVHANRSTGIAFEVLCPRCTRFTIWRIPALPRVFKYATPRLPHTARHRRRLDLGDGAAYRVGG